MKSACFTGHRPDKLYGYNLETNEYRDLLNRIIKVIAKLYREHGVDTFISGGALGADTVAFFSVEYLKKQGYPLKNVLAIPFKGQEGKWSKTDKERYNRMLKQADNIIYVDKEKGYNYPNSSIARKLNTRNHYMVDNSSYIIAIYDINCNSGGTYNCIQYGKKYNKNIIYIEI